MAFIDGSSQALSDDNIECAQKILSKFPHPTYIPTPENKAAYVWALIGKCPCDTCPMNIICRNTNHECAAFRQFVARGRWNDDDVAADLK